MHKGINASQDNQNQSILDSWKGSHWSNAMSLSVSPHSIPTEGTGCMSVAVGAHQNLLRVVFAAYTTLSQESSSLPKLKDHFPALFPEQTDQKAEAREGHVTLRSGVIDRTEP